VERDRAITHFKPVDHFCITLTCQYAGIQFDADWLPGSFRDKDNDKTEDEQQEDDTGEVSYDNLVTDRNIPEGVIARTQRVIVESVQTKRVSIAPPLPLITSSFVKLMASRLRLSTKASMDAAQKLFENGLITYHRTDSPVMGDEFADEVRFFAQSQGLPVPKAKRALSAKAGAQEGHECLRVTDIRQARVELSDPVLEEVYHWVWVVTLQSQLASAEEDRTQIVLKNEHEDKFLAKGRVEVVEGWKESWKLTMNAEKESQDAEGKKNAVEKKLPAIAKGNEPEIQNTKLHQKKTKAPGHFTEKTLVAKLDQLKIGRPSTYAQTIERIVTQEYVTRDKNLTLKCSPLGDAIVSVLDHRFEFMQYDYTAELEDLIDDIASRKMNYKELVDAVYVSLVANNQALKNVSLNANLIAAIKNISVQSKTKNLKSK
jgi:DNA topoisomerase I